MYGSVSVRSASVRFGRALRYGLDLGPTVIGAAEMHGAENLMGETVRGRRDEAYVVSKVLHGNVSNAGTTQVCECSLHWLFMDRIGLYLFY